MALRCGGDNHHSKILQFIVLLPVLLNAQNIVFTASCDRTQVPLGETFTLEAKISGNIHNPPNPELPPMENFNVVSTSRMQSISIINGRTSAEVSFVYTLSPRKIGKFTIGSCTMKYKGKVFKTQPVEIEVVKSAAPSMMPSTTPSLPGGGKGDKDLFATLSVNKSRAYVNEQIILSFKFYQAVNLLSSPQYTPPSFTGFWKEDLGQSREYKIVNGRRYLVNEIRYAIFPTQQGIYTIKDAEMECRVEDFSQDFFSFSFGGRTKVIRANPIKIKVLDLPGEGKPADFSGAVGKFDFSIKLDNTKVHQHEPATLVLTISGVGNIKSIEPPKLPSFSDFKIYHSGSKVNLVNSKNKVSGKKIFNIMLIPEREGEFEIPGVSFSYFEPKSGKYKTLTTSTQHLTVLAGEASSRPTTTLSGQPIEILGKDIHYIKTQVKLNNETQYIYRNHLFLLIQLIPILCLLISLKYAKQKERLTKDKTYARAVKADKFAKKGLLQCSKLLTKGEPKEFYEEVYRTSTEYIGGKLNIPGPALTVDVAIRRLKEKKVQEETIKKLQALFSTCDLAKFGLGSLDLQDMKSSYDELSSLIAELSKKL